MYILYIYNIYIYICIIYIYQIVCLLVLLLCHTLIVREAVVFYFFFLNGGLGDEFWLEVNLYFGTWFFRSIAIVYDYLFFLFFNFFIAIVVFFFYFYLSILYSKQIALVSYGKILEKAFQQFQVSFNQFAVASINLLLQFLLC